MQNIIDLPVFPTRYRHNRTYRSASLRVELWDDTIAKGRLLEFNTAKDRLILEKDDGDLQIFPFQKVKAGKFLTSRNLAAEATEGLLLGKLELIDGSSWSGQVLYYLKDRAGLHILALENDAGVRYFFPHASVKSQSIGRRLGDMLLEEQKVAAADIEEALLAQQNLMDNHEVVPKLGEILVTQGKITEGELQDTLAVQLGVEAINLERMKPDVEVLSLIPEYIAREHHLVPISRTADSIVVAMLDVTAIDDLNLVGFLTGLIPEPLLTTPRELQWALDSFYTKASPAKHEEEQDSDHGKSTSIELEMVKNDGHDKPIVNLVDVIMKQAINQGASDIHLRPGEEKVELLFRIDGNMTFIRDFPKSLLSAIVSRIKIMSGMDISERRTPQDGQTRVIEGEVVIDMRVSMIPTVDGESVVIRLLNTKYGPLTIDQLGFSAPQEQQFVSHLKKSHGLILVTGPTGSGKSTTLYVALDQVKKRNLSIVTIENPVEFHIPGVDQVQINERTGLTFARVLRNILRHDPEVIMIGEIRDQETARIAVQSSLTGHLVLSTLHTNSAVGAVSRLADMDIEPYLLGPTVLCVIAQRLLKKNCEHCRVVEEVGPALQRQLNVSEDETFYYGEGCSKCNGKGLKGRVGVYEFLNVSEKIAEAITESKDENEIQRLADEEGMVGLLDGALELARKGTISLSQVYAISSEI